MPARTEGEAIATRLLGDAAITALVSQRVFPSKPTQDPQNDYIVYYRVGGGDGRTLKGRSRLQNYQVRVEATAMTQAKAEAIMAAVRNSLTPPDETWKYPENGIEGVHSTADADEQTLEDGRQVSGQTFGVWFRPPAAT